MAVADEMLEVLREIRDELRKRPEPKLQQSAPRSAGAVAPDEDLDGEWGDVKIKHDPPRWLKQGGNPLAPTTASQCPPEYLDAYASFRDWQAQRDEAKGTPKDMERAAYARKDAARARGWAARKRAQPADVGDVPF
jgi:hypothetical protein